MMRKQWIITPERLPTIRRRCPKCGNKTEFVNSGKFRVNANGRLLDVWLIYKCEKCDTTWNLTVHERVDPNSIQPEIYEAFLRNDESVAAEYGINRELFVRNKAEISETQGSYKVKVLDTTIPCTYKNCQEIEIKITSCVKLRADILFGEQLGLSRSQIKKMFDKEKVMYDQTPVKAGSKVRNGVYRLAAEDISGIDQNISKHQLHQGSINSDNYLTKTGMAIS